ncbi:hypothetical protein, partial [Escherichia coli]|uniref:hypothetical protein n=1 Tax=Escherichia coli TaxID=562 RepID=UPI0015F15618
PRKKELPGLTELLSGAAAGLPPGAALLAEFAEGVLPPVCFCWASEVVVLLPAGELADILAVDAAFVLPSGEPESDAVAEEFSLPDAGPEVRGAELAES